MACSEDITKLSGVLMTLEMQLVEQLEVRGALAPQVHPGGWCCCSLLASPVRFQCVPPSHPAALAAGRAHASGSPHPPWKGQSLGRGF